MRLIGSRFETAEAGGFPYLKPMPMPPALLLIERESVKTADDRTKVAACLVSNTPGHGAYRISRGRAAISKGTGMVTVGEWVACLLSE